MKALKLVFMASLGLLIANTVNAQFKVGDNRLSLGDERLLEIERASKFFIVTDSLEMGRTTSSTSNNPATDALMLKLYGYGLGNFTPSLTSTSRSYFLGTNSSGEVLEFPLSLTLFVSSDSATLYLNDGTDLFGRIDLERLDSIYVTDNELNDSLITIRQELADTAFVLRNLIGNSTLYTSDGTLEEDRTVSGDGNSLTFTGVDTFAINGADISLTTSGDINSTVGGDQASGVTGNSTGTVGGNSSLTTTGTNLSSSGGTNTVTSTGGDVVISSSTGAVDMNASDVTISDTVTIEKYGQYNITGTHAYILGVTSSGKIIDVSVADILGSEIDSTIYNSDGILEGDRILTGGGNSLTFTGVDTFAVNGADISLTTSGDINSTVGGDQASGVTGNSTGTVGGNSSLTTTGTNLSSSGGANTVTSTGGDVVISSSTGAVDMNASDVTISDTVTIEKYGQYNITGTHAYILGVTSSGKIIDVSVADILGSEIDSTIYNSDGILEGDRIVTGGGNSLTFTGVDTFAVNGADISLTTSGDINSTVGGDQASGVTGNSTGTVGGNSSLTTTGTNLSSSGGANTVTSTGGDVVISSSTGAVDMNASDVTISDTVTIEKYGQYNITGTHAYILGVTSSGKIIDVSVADILGSEIDSTIYNSDGILEGDRILTGGGNSLTFTGVDTFAVNGADISLTTSGDINSTVGGDQASGVTGNSTGTVGGNSSLTTTGTNLSSSGGANTVTSTGGDVVISSSTGAVDMNASDVTISDTVTIEKYGQYNITGTHAYILGVTSSGKIIDVSVADILGSEIDSTIYNSDGILEGDRILTGGGNSLTFTGVDTFAVNGADISLTTSGDINSTVGGDQASGVTGNSTGTVGGNSSLTTTGTNLSSSGGANTVTSTGGDVVISSSTGAVDMNASDVTISDTVTIEKYGQYNITGTHAYILGVTSSGKIIDVSVADILGSEIDSTIYNSDGSLDSERTMSMAGFNLMFVGSSNDTTIFTDDGRIGIGTGSIVTGTGTPNDVRLHVNGDILANQIHSSSDQRFKKNITGLSNALDKVMKINGVNYDFRTEEFPNRDFPRTRQLGFLAQDLEKEVPEVVKTGPDGFKSVDYAKLTALLNEAIKEQQMEINDLRAALNQSNVLNAKLANDIDLIKTMIKNLSNHNLADE